MVAEVAEVRALVQMPCGEHAARRNEFIAALFTRHRRSLLWYLTRLIANRADAEEIAQEAFVRLLAAPLLETHAGRARNYLFATATNLARDNYRRRTARAESAHISLDDLQLETNDPQPERLVDAERGRFIVESASGFSAIRSRGADLRAHCARARRQQEDDRARHRLDDGVVPVEASALGRNVSARQL
jgi:RNA polymerase sigma factor (sigma-70 family)